MTCDPASYADTSQAPDPQLLLFLQQNYRNPNRAPPRCQWPAQEQ